MKLTIWMFGSEFDHRADTEAARTAFGLSCGQMRHPDVIHNGGWYNRDGEKLGWGDLSPMDLLTISRRLEDGWKDKPAQWFLVLGESDSFWAFRDESTNVEAYGWLQHIKPEADKPGILYVASKARYAIGPNVIVRLNEHGDQLKTNFFMEEKSSLYQLKLDVGIRPRAWLWQRLNLPMDNFCLQHDQLKTLCTKYGDTHDVK